MTSRHVAPKLGLTTQRLRTLGGLVALLVLVVVIGRFVWQSPAPALHENVILSVERGDIEKVVMVTGTLKPSMQVNVGAQVNGQIRKLYVKQGDKVVKGELLAEIDPTIQQSELKNATARLSSAQAQKRAAEATLIQYIKAYRRQVVMQRDGSGIRSEYEQAQAQYEAQLQQVNVNEALITQSEMDVQTAQANLNFTRIIAPISGEVLGIVANEGQTIVSSQTAPTILVLANLDKMQVQTRISEADIQKIHPGQPLTFYVIADPETHYESTMGYVQPIPPEALDESNNNSGGQQNSAIYYNGTFEVDNADRALKTSMTAQVFIRVAQAKDALRLPVSALGRAVGANQYEVTVINNEKPEARTIKVGINDRHFVEVLEGISEGEQVVIQSDNVAS
ncbi:efflux RND transporter periplasmic adaptor subunit [Providencia hangzhouensis]|uniref:Macrolide-specific efflux protein macA n=1 Tax=Providencia rettgeri TaxID=587 RepID=A0A9N8D0K4_PRORE|nr:MULTISPECIES: efflux RND transporter periplasmic adaptor subunit [Providencia]MCB4854801.1 efflux RND transporter periplasmic adaptor subunit [Providencia rettgeri]MCD6314821.1 efflux RND transporter periplasmic adaptor subunit [Providencia rettgeri]MCG9518698.1 efflux RND transporter periplasmic adaptor subunit [Providencia rettgeri]MCG9531982.1 efflux RND transporter periplasmic adaptor subunit [Providencia rettgeri]MCS4544869.1 efflux RND transporter periplasmic adaptor subunit [Providen